MEYSEPPPRNRVRLIVTSEYSMSRQPVGVINRQVHLGAPQRRAPRCPRENHVRHVPATQRAGTLLAHDPGERVDDVGFTRPLGPTTHVMPGWRASVVALAKDLKPRSVRFLRYTLAG